MVYVFYSKLERDAVLSNFDCYLANLPLGFRRSIEVCKDRNTQLLRITGRLLLHDALKLSGIPEGLHKVKINSAGRPVLGGNTDCNISHSGDYAICAVSKGIRVGVDIEQVREVKVSDFSRYFTCEQMEFIARSKKPKETFFKYWTSLESLVKAQGDGFSKGVPKIKKVGKASCFRGGTWYTREIKIAPGYFCSLSVDRPEVKVMVQAKLY